MSFSFDFSGADIEEDHNASTQLPTNVTGSIVGPSPATTQKSAFPVEGKPQLPVVEHGLENLLARLPSKIAYSRLAIPLDGGSSVSLPRRELWDVRVQLMAEAEAETEAGLADSDAMVGLGEHDVKTGVYEGGFKSWESSVDLIKVLASDANYSQAARTIMELGCGTALPTLALLFWTLQTRLAQLSSAPTDSSPKLTYILADYNPTVLELVTLPNLLLTWALATQSTSPTVQAALAAEEDELEISPELCEEFRTALAQANIHLRFLSGAWSESFVQQLYNQTSNSGIDNDSAVMLQGPTLLLGAETIYSPFAQRMFLETVLSLMQREKQRSERNNNSNNFCALVAAKRMYFGVGGSLDDFVESMRLHGVTVREVREETVGVRRGVIECML